MSDKFRKAFRRLLSCGKLDEANPHNHLYCYNQDHSRANPASSSNHPHLHRGASSPSSAYSPHSRASPRNHKPVPKSQSNHSVNHLTPEWTAATITASPCHSKCSSRRVSVGTQIGGINCSSSTSKHSPPNNSSQISNTHNHRVLISPCPVNKEKASNSNNVNSSSSSSQLTTTTTTSARVSNPSQAETTF